jgi:hypothetical protein
MKAQIRLLLAELTLRRIDRALPLRISINLFPRIP